MDEIETTQLLFGQSMLNRSSDLRSGIELAKFRLFIYSKLMPEINKIYGNFSIPVGSPGSGGQQDVFVSEVQEIRAKL